MEEDPTPEQEDVGEDEDFPPDRPMFSSQAADALGIGSSSSEEDAVTSPGTWGTGPGLCPGISFQSGKFNVPFSDFNLSASRGESVRSLLRLFGLIITVFPLYRKLPCQKPVVAGGMIFLLFP